MKRFIKKKLEKKDIVIGTGIVIDDILYKPLKIAEESEWNKCEFCDYNKACLFVMDGNYHCDSFGAGMILKRYGKILGATIVAGTDEQEE